MTERHRELCLRYFQRLHDRLAGRGARKARNLLLLILERLDDLRENISGSRLQIYARLEELLPRRIPGGPRNVRDCLDLLVRTSPMVRAEPGKRCTWRFAELHDAESELMRFITDELERHEPAANAAPMSNESPIPEPEIGPLAPVTAAPHVTRDRNEIANAVEPCAAPETSNAQAAPCSLTAPAAERPPEMTSSLLEVFRRLGREPEKPSSPATATTPPSHEPTVPRTATAIDAPPSRPQTIATGHMGRSRKVMQGLVRRGSYFLGEFVPDIVDDDSDAPSRFRGSDETDLLPDEEPNPSRKP